MPRTLSAKAFQIQSNPIDAFTVSEVIHRPIASANGNRDQGIDY
jgi:hypothetical protein